MNKNVLIVLGGAFVIAVLVAVMVQAMLGGSKKQQAVQEARAQILVAAKDLGIGHELQPGDLRWQEWPKTSTFPGVIERQTVDQTPEKMLQGRLARDIAAGEPVMKSAMLEQAKGNFVAASLEPGMRAVAVEVSAAGMVAGFIGPGDYVDVILTYKQSIRTDDDNPRMQALVDRNLDKLATETILQNIKVLAVDQKAQRPDEDQVKVGKTVTLAADVQAAEKLSLAQGMGELTLALRGVGDDILVDKNWRTISDARLTKVDDEIILEYKKLQKDTGINPNIVRIYNGSQVQVVPTQ